MLSLSVRDNVVLSAVRRRRRSEMTNQANDSICNKRQRMSKTVAPDFIASATRKSGSYNKNKSVAFDNGHSDTRRSSFRSTDSTGRSPRQLMTNRGSLPRSRSYDKSKSNAVDTQVAQSDVRNSFSYLKKLPLMSSQETTTRESLLPRRTNRNMQPSESSRCFPPNCNAESISSRKADVDTDTENAYPFTEYTGPQSDEEKDDFSNAQAEQDTDDENQKENVSVESDQGFEPVDETELQQFDQTSDSILKDSICRFSNTFGVKRLCNLQDTPRENSLLTIFIHKGMVFAVDLSDRDTIVTKLTNFHNRAVKKKNQKKIDDCRFVQDALRKVSTPKQVIHLFRQKLTVRERGDSVLLCGQCKQTFPSRIWFEGHLDRLASKGCCSTEPQCVSLGFQLAFVVDTAAALQISWLEDKVPLLNPLMRPHHSKPGQKGLQLYAHEREPEKGYVHTIITSKCNATEHDALSMAMARKLHAFELAHLRPEKKKSEKDRFSWHEDSFQLVNMPYILPVSMWPADMQARVNHLRLELRGVGDSDSDSVAKVRLSLEVV